VQPNLDRRLDSGHAPEIDKLAPATRH
jgi:hypothetical protein